MFESWVSAVSDSQSAGLHRLTERYPVAQTFSLLKHPHLGHLYGDQIFTVLVFLCYHPIFRDIPIRNLAVAERVGWTERKPCVFAHIVYMIRTGNHLGQVFVLKLDAEERVIPLLERGLNAFDMQT